MNNIIVAVVACVGAIAGAIGGHVIRSSNGDSHGSAAGSGHAERAHDAAKSSESESKASYFRFTREFVVPQLSDGRVSSLVILHVSLETDSDLSQSLFSMEPKLRDNIMSTLIEIGSDGVTYENITSVESYESIRSLILMNIRNVVPEGIRNVLILDMAKQDV